MGDMFKERKRMQLELESKLLYHKTLPYVGSDDGDLIAKIAPFCTATKMQTSTQIQRTIRTNDYTINKWL